MNSPERGEHPFVVLHPAEVRAAAVYLQTVSFDERWEVAGPELSQPYIGWEDRNAPRTSFREYHDDLRAFYGAAALAGHAVVKAFWY